MPRVVSVLDGPVPSKNKKSKHPQSKKWNMQLTCLVQPLDPTDAKRYTPDVLE